LNLKLHVIKRDDLDDYSTRYRFCFAVIDLSKSKNYPSNFVCLLPVQIRKSKDAYTFEKLFEEKRVEQAKILLSEELKSAEDSNVRVDIERGLKLLEPKTDMEMKYSNCGKLYVHRSIRRFKNNFCINCLKKKFGYRQ
jgi:transposase